MKMEFEKQISEQLEILSKYEVNTDWREKAIWRRNNRQWLRYSQFIAMMVLKRLEVLGYTQKQLAEKLGCSAQYVSKIVKGSENLTLETISKLEQVLEIDILKSSLSLKYNYETDDNPSIRIVAEPEGEKYGK